MWKQLKTSRLVFHFWDPFAYKACPSLSLSLFDSLLFTRLREKSYICFIRTLRRGQYVDHVHQKLVMLITSRISLCTPETNWERNEERAIEKHLACFATNRGTTQRKEPAQICALSAYKAMPLNPTKLIYYVVASVLFHLCFKILSQPLVRVTNWSACRN